MEEERKRIYTVVAVVAVVALVLSCAAGALAGGLAGFWMGQRQARAAEMAVANALQELRRFEMPVPLPEEGRERIVPPLEGLPSGLHGAIVTEVVEGTPAAEAGLTPGDVITGVDNIPIDRNHALPDVVSQYQPGDRVTVHLLRDGREESLQVRLGENPDDPSRAYLGVFFQAIPDLDLQLPED